MKTIVSICTVIGLAGVLNACVPVAQAPAAKVTTNQASVRLSEPTGDAVGLDTSAFSASRIEASGQGVGTLYFTQVLAQQGGGTENPRTVQVQIGAKLAPGFTCELNTSPPGVAGVTACNLTYAQGKTTLQAASGTFRVTSLEGGTLRFAAQANLTTKAGGTLKLDLEGKVENFVP
jgi:hypothetical protein